MKSTSLVLHLIACGALISGSSCGLSCTAQSGQPTSVVGANQIGDPSLNAPKATAIGDEKGLPGRPPAARKQTIHDTAHSLGRGLKNPPGTTHLISPSKAQSKPAYVIAIAPHLATPIQFPGSRGAGIARTSAVKRTVDRRPSNMTRPCSQSLGPARHRSINPPTIGGFMGANHASNGIISGASVHRKP
jgi:hypothetical protein